MNARPGTPPADRVRGAPHDPVDALSFVLHRSRHDLDIVENRVESGDRGRHLPFFDQR